MLTLPMLLQSLPQCLSSGESLLQDAVSSTPPVQDGETLVPTVPDVLISFACLPASAADRCAGETSVYVRALMDHLRPGVDVKEALNKVNQQFKDRLSQYSPQAKADVVSTVKRPIVFPSRR